MSSSDIHHVSNMILYSVLWLQIVVVLLRYHTPCCCVVVATVVVATTVVVVVVNTFVNILSIFCKYILIKA